MNTNQTSKTLAALCLTAGLATAWDATAGPVALDPIGLNVDPAHTLYDAVFLYMGFSSGLLTYSYQPLGDIPVGHNHFDFSLPAPDTDALYYYGVVANYAFDFGFPATLTSPGTSIELPTAYSVTLGLKDGSLDGLPFPFGDENSFGSALDLSDFAAIAAALESSDGYLEFPSSAFRPDEVGFGADGTLSGVLVDFPNQGTLAAGPATTFDTRSFASFSIGPDPEAVPEPSTYAAIIGLAGIVGGTWWRRRAAK